VNPGPPEISFGHVLGGWRTRAGEGKRTPENEVLVFAKYTLLPGKRSKFQEVLLEGLKTIDEEEPGTLSILLIEDNSKPDVMYVMDRFKDQASFEAHMNGSGSSKVEPVLKECVKSREGGEFKYLTGFLWKDE
jgi:quinol monooxygenase YgiN